MVAAGLATSLSLGHTAVVHADTETTTETTTTDSDSNDLTSGSSDDEKEILRSFAPWAAVLALLWFIGKSYPTPEWFPKIGF